MGSRSDELALAAPGVIARLRRSFPVVAVVAISGAVVLFFWPFVFLGRIPVDADFLLANAYPWKAEVAGAVTQYNPEHLDPVLVMYPLKHVAIAQLLRGELPLWNPHVLAGTPLLASGMAQGLSPFNVPFFFLDFPTAWAVSLMLQFLVAGLGMCAFLRTLGLGPGAALVGGLAYMLNGVFAVWLEHAWYVGAFAWLPVACFLIERAFQSGQVRFALWAGVAMACQVFAGAPQASLYTLLASAAYAGWKALDTTRRGTLPARRAALLAGVAVVAGLALSLPQTLASLELAGVASRSPAKYAGGNFLHPYMLLGYVAPEFFGHPLDRNYVGDEIFYRSYIRFSPPYVGLLPLMLAVLAVTSRRLRQRWFFLALSAGLVGFLLLLLLPPWYRLVQTLLPGFDSLDHQRAMGLFAFGAAVLAAMGYDDAARRLVSARRVVLVALATVAALLLTALLLEALARLGPDGILPMLQRTTGGRHSLTGPRRFLEYLADLSAAHGSVLLFRGLGLPLVLAVGAAVLLVIRRASPSPLVGATVLAFVLADLLVHGVQYNPYNAPATVYPETASIRVLKAQPGIFRVVGLAEAEHPQLHGSVFPPNSASMYGLDDPRGYEALHPRWVYELLTGSEVGNAVFYVPPDLRLLELMNVRYLVTPRPIDDARVRLAHRSGPLLVYELTGSLPRAFFVGRATAVEPGRATREYLLSPGFVPREEVVLAAAEMPEPPAVAAHRARGSVTIASYSASAVRLRVSAEEAGYLVLLDAFFPGWRAEIDGRETRLLRANHAFRAVRVERGTHEVVFTYRPAYLRPALGASLLVLAVTAGASVLAARSPRKGPR